MHSESLELRTPLDSSDIKKLHAGNVVYLTGTILTARDAAHARLVEADPSDLPHSLVEALSHGVIYHCGPVVRTRDDGSHEIIAAGPTTSARMNAVQQEVMEKFDIVAIVGKGGMHGVDFPSVNGAYLAFIGGAALLASNAITGVIGVEWLDDLGAPEAAWILAIDRFGPLVVAQDCHGMDLYRDVVSRAKMQLDKSSP
ncbi:fumarate hydratase [Candidatus Bathyarchaeota archaeon]|nr:fumarate hydratase [Candidatus Bathyarchaeota archaeon]